MAELRPDLLAETIAIRPTVPAPNGNGRLAAHPASEYIAAGGSILSPAYLRALPQWIDPLDRDFPDSIYETMLLDPAVAASVTLLKVAILSEETTLTPPVPEDDPAFDRARELADFCQRAIDDLSEPFEDTLFELLDALWAGNRVAELVYRPGDGPDAGRLTLDRVKVKPRRAVAFVVDPYLNVLGILGRLAGPASNALNASLISAEAPPPNLLPRQKFAVLTWRPSDGDPRGTSLLRPAYNAWWVKTQAWPGFLKYLAQFGNPSLIGFTPESGPQRVQSYASDGTVETDAAGNPIYITPEQAMLNALLAFQSSSAAVFPNGATVTILEPKGPAGSGQVYERAVEILDRQIVLAILCQTLSTGEARYGARAAAQVHQDVLGLVIRQGKKALARCIRRDILTPLVRYNFGEAALALVPTVSLGATEQEDKAAIMNAVANLGRAGLVDPSQLRLLDQMLGLPIRDEAAVTIQGQQEPEPSNGKDGAEGNEADDGEEAA